jgi:hypothetical protein
VGESTPAAQREARKRSREAVCLLADVVANAFGRKLLRGGATIRKPVFVEDFTRILQQSEVSAANVVLGEVRLVLAISSCRRASGRPSRRASAAASERGASHHGA